MLLRPRSTYGKTIAKSLLILGLALEFIYTLLRESVGQILPRIDKLH